ncbi:MAG TPA: class II glutamine amidotransferase [Spirochaetota bacterium]|nr:class II glutamine amidotransferase [Spirochaetota bacterium]HOM87642.1 class II glutamine amidotransferase [Spirochaetota bacterium]HQG41992.1 class II glutamine amidotransferase [Spirochaetota bacterium]HQK07052.1 class II glutamine amidotransferase [Spirochaetota bacterium]HRV15159.1 class II glutamine amidotransferase [Spirochaetota bacterium]
MCELLGLSFNQPVKMNLSFRGFRRRGKENPDGWGLAFYPDGSVQIIKEPISADRSTLSKFIMGYPGIKSKIYIAHVRFASVSSITYKNTHPFQRELNGREFVFAHNGTLDDYKGLDLGRFKPVGGTDSEWAFCHILKSIEERNIIQWEEEHFRWLWNQLGKINTYGKFNCLFSDGEYLFCYFDKNGYNGLCLVHRVAPFDRVYLIDEDFEINLAEEKDPSQKGFIVATKPLTNERWENFSPGELIVFKNGNIIFSSSGRNTEQFSSPLNENEINILRTIRHSPHRLSLKAICEYLGLSCEEIKPQVHSLLCKGFIKQDSRDRVKWDDNDATFYTESSQRAEIDSLIGE